MQRCWQTGSGDVGMKEALAAILQQRMDGCSRDQAWAVTAVSGLNGLLVAGATDVGRIVPAWCAVSAVLLAGAYAVYYTIDRHHRYYLYRASLAELVATEEAAPNWMKVAPTAAQPKTWIGSAFFTAWIIGATVLGVLALLTPKQP
jgi:hypothetical protein